MHTCSHKDKTEDNLLPVQTDSKFISIKIIISKSTWKKVMLARTHTMFLTNLGREDRRQKDEDCLIIWKLPLVFCVDHIKMCQTCLLVCISCGFSLAMGWWKRIKFKGDVVLLWKDGMSYPPRNKCDPVTLLLKSLSRILLYRIESKCINLACQIFLAHLSSLSS